MTDTSQIHSTYSLPYDGGIDADPRQRHRYGGAREAGTDQVHQHGRADDRADLGEVVLALRSLRGLSAEAIEDARLRKRVERGGFDGRIWNAAVGAPWRSRPRSPVLTPMTRPPASCRTSVAANPGKMSTPSASA